ncbi:MULTISPECIES: hypothetical protein [Caloramator]|uniref:hypothetical protein n=1 Tax=Caloramator TaxID=44258 RepID=UPI00058F8E5B|nr:MULTISPECIES: hypothetical protein [Caloramator]MDO6354002.1 hypothetical protein [Caloramator sp. CAR-1]
MTDYLSALRGIGNGISNGLDNIGRTLFHLQGHFTYLGNLIKITNILLLFIVVILGINAYINWKRYKNDIHK